MIVSMKKTCLIALLQDRDSALAELTKLGVMHVSVKSSRESADRSGIEQKIQTLDSAYNTIVSSKGSGKSSSAKFADLDTPALHEAALKIMEKLSELSKTRDRLLASREKLLPWGNFDSSALAKLNKSGINIGLCSAPESVFEELRRKCTAVLIRESKGLSFFAVISDQALDSSLPFVQLPPEALAEIERQILANSQESKKLEEDLASMKKRLHDLSGYKKELMVWKEYLAARDGMLESGKLVCISGFVPEPSIALLSETARLKGWGLSIETPSEDDQVPTLIKYPWIAQVVKPIFEFIGVSPGYHEWDVSACFLFFFTIFFSMIVADAGYGVLFLTAAIILKMKFGKKDEFRLPINLFIVLSSATIFWGLITGSFFAISTDKLPPFLRGMKIFTDPDSKDRNIQLLCFILAATHLSFARVWKAVIISNLKSLGQLGWAFMIWANFFTISGLIVFEAQIWKYTPVLYAIAIVLLLLFYVDWRNLGEIFNFPFSLVGSFTDVLSYIRLYAVGLSSFYIAMNTNDLGSMLMINPVLTVFGVLLIFVGHLGNIVMSFLGVLVHGIRLNTLEFSNHMELQWKGIPFKALRELPSGLNKTTEK